MEDLEDIEDVEVIYLDDDSLEEVEETEEMVDSENYAENDVEVPDLSKLTFSKHTKSVFCCDISKDNQLIATGGEDDSAFLWSATDGNVKFECTGHKDSITAICFNHDSQLLATGDMSGMIQVWDIKNNKLIWCYEGDDMDWLMWHSLTNVLLSGSHSGEVYIWQVPPGNCKILPSHGSSCSYGKLLPDGKQILTGYEDGHIKLWDIKATSTKWQFLDTQKSNVTSLEISPDGALCSVAPSSTLIKMSSGKAIGTLLPEGEADIETHVFTLELNLLITGSLSGQICVWDLQTQTIRQKAKLDYGITILKLGLNGRAFIGSTDGAIYICDVRTGSLAEILTGHKASILSMCMSHCGTFIVTTSDDQTAKIFSIKNQ